MIEDRLEAGEAVSSLRRGLLQPEGVPLRVATTAAVAVAAAGSATERELRWWRAEPAEGRMVTHLAAIASAATRGEISSSAAAVIERYGPPGVAASIGFAALARMEGSGSQPIGADGYDLGPARHDRDAIDVLSAIRRAFGEIPEPWGAVAYQIGAVRRWWTLHEVVMRHGAITGEEKWLTAVASYRALGCGAAAIPYERLLEEWSPDGEEREAAIRGTSTRLRPGFRKAQQEVAGLTVGAIDQDRARLFTAGMTPAEEHEYWNVILFARGLSTYVLL